MSAIHAAGAILELCRSHLGTLEAVSVASVSWASATFEGVQITIAFTVARIDPAPFLRDLPEVEIAMGDRFVAEIRVVSCNDRFGGWYVVLEALVLDLVDA